MTCAGVDERLDDYVDGALPAAQTREVEAHLQGCAACRQEEKALRNLLAVAAGLARETSPPRDLWPEIAERIRSERRGIGSWPRWAAAALAAAAVVSIALLASVVGRQAPPVAPVAPTPVQAEKDPLREAEADYARATSALLSALEQRRDLSPKTLASVRSNLDVIDQALGEVRAALAKDPANPELTRMLASTHRKKVDVLRRVMRLTAPL
jgi:predicted anti-sigma-YlaC factor YlaD